ncbi:MAG TPA: hypothetical protein VIK38_07705 [Coriobacteriia bacterium]
MSSEGLRIPVALRDRAQQIIDVTDTASREHLDEEYGLLARRLVARLARMRPSPLSVDAYNDEEQLSGFLVGAEEALVRGEQATIAGVSVEGQQRFALH